MVGKRMAQLGLLLAAVLLVIGASGALADQEPNDDFASAEEINGGTTVQGSLTYDVDEVDTYKVAISGGDIVKVHFESGTGNDFLYLDLYDWEEYTLFGLKSKGEVPEDDEYYTAKENDWPYVYIQVTSDTEGGSYQFALTVDRQNDGGSQGDAAEAAAEAIVIGEGTCTGQIEDEDDVDFYKFEMGEGDYVHVSFTSEATGDFQYLELRDWEDWTMWSMDSKEKVPTEDWYFTANETVTAWWYIVVSLDTGPGPYEFTLEVMHQDDAGLGIDVPGALVEAVALETEKTLGGMLEDEDELDTFYIMVEPGDYLRFTFQSEAVSDQTLYLYDTEEWTVLGLDSSQGTEVTSEVWTANETEGGKWYVVIDMTNDPSEAFGTYTFKVQVGSQDDAGSATDVAATVGRSYPLQDGEYTGDLGGMDTGDAYRIPIDVWWEITVTLTNQALVALNVAIIGDCGVTTIGTLSSSDGTVAIGTWPTPEAPLTCSYWEMVVTPEQGWEPGSYTLKVETNTSAIPPDDEKPVITFASPPSEAKTGEDVTLELSVNDNTGLESVKLYFKIDDEVVWNELSMTLDGTDYTASIAKDTFEDGKTIHWYIVAEDTSGNKEFFGNETTPRSMQVTKPDDDDDSPGFGPLMAVAALGAGMVLAGRRRR